MKAHHAAEKIVAAAKKGNLNEADTRHQIIDRILHEVLGWPQESVSCEKSVSTGYLDYCLRDRAQRTVLVIEAKREGESFSLPLKITKYPDKIQRVRLRTLVTNAEIKAAVTQAVGYCPQVGCEYACVTNGHSFIIFRSFIRGKDYLDADALVIPSVEFFSKSFTEAINLLGYDSITKDRSLASITF
jgi:predicted type IV restriction endonuclease